MLLEGERRVVGGHEPRARVAHEDGTAGRGAGGADDRVVDALGCEIDEPALPRPRSASSRDHRFAARSSRSVRSTCLRTNESPSIVTRSKSRARLRVRALHRFARRRAVDERVDRRRERRAPCVSPPAIAYPLPSPEPSPPTIVPTPVPRPQSRGRRHAVGYIPPASTPISRSPSSLPTPPTGSPCRAFAPSTSSSTPSRISLPSPKPTARWRRWCASGLARTHPSDAVVGEEFGATGDSNRRWIIDPIDGTKGYARGHPGLGHVDRAGT